jgi:hypothetical protein
MLCCPVVLFAVGGRGLGGCFAVTILRLAGGFLTVVVVMLGGCLATLQAWRVLVAAVVVLADAWPLLLRSVDCLLVDPIPSCLSFSLAVALPLWS